MTDALIAELERATEGSRGLDAEIWLTLPGNTRRQWSYTHEATGRECHVDETRDANHRLVIVPYYTTNIDSAITLVPEGRWWVLNSGVQSRSALAQVEHENGGWDKYEGRGATPAIALCIAALKTRKEPE